MIDLTPTGRESFAFNINAAGHIAGDCSMTTPPTHACLWVDGAILDLDLTGGSAIALNDYDTVVGDYLVDAPANNYHPSLWRSSGEFVDLGLLAGDNSGMAEAINNAEQVVGYSQGGSMGSRGFLWENGTIYDLNDLLLDGEGWKLGTAYDINELGQIVGVGTNPSGEQCGYLLTPVPEPATLSLLAVGGLMALVRRRRRK
jgi:probable HAF family extracellular repeat protein